MFTKLFSNLFLVILAAFLLAGCSADNQTKEENPTSGNAAQEQQIDSDLQIDKETADEVAKDESVSKATVQLSELEGKKFVNADIEVDKTIKNIDEIAEKHARELKEKYPGRTVDILIIQEGKVVKQLTEK